MFNLGKKLGFAALLAFSATSANAVVLDTFDYTPDDFKISTTQAGYLIEQNGGYTFGSATDNDILVSNINPQDGDVFYELTSQGGNTTSFVDGLALNNNSDSSSVLNITYGELSLDSNGDLVNAGIPLPFSSFGDSFYYDIAKLNVGNSSSDDLDVIIEVIGLNGVAHSISDTFIANIDSLTTQYVSFASFGAVADFFDAITEVNITLTAGDDVDLRLTEFGVVPEPTTLAIFGLGLIGFAASRKRKA